MLQRLYADNYKCLVNFELNLQELSLLLGPNGAGKTSVLDIVFALRHLLGGGARVTDADTFPTHTLTRWQERDIQTFEIDVLLDSDSFSYRLEVDHDRTSRRARIVTERLSQNRKPLFDCQMGEVRLYRDDYSEGPHYTADWTESALARVAPPERYRRLTQFREARPCREKCDLCKLADFTSCAVRGGLSQHLCPGSHRPEIEGWAWCGIRFPFPGASPPVRAGRPRPQDAPFPGHRRP